MKGRTKARFGTAKKEYEVERVYRLVKTWLIDCRLLPGYFISELILSQECKTSRTPVREACNRLSQEKWLTRIPQKGYMVAPISLGEIVEVYEYRKMLECFAAEKAAGAVRPPRYSSVTENNRGGVES